MGIKFKEAALPDVSALDFRVDYWDGVNQTRAAQKNSEMANCQNMSIDNFPYASPRKPRQKLVDEQGIKRIYKIEDGKIYCIDSSDRLCYFKDGVKTMLTPKNLNDEEEEAFVYNCFCTNNYDKSSIFYPQMVYTDSDGVYREIGHKVNYTKQFLTSDESDYKYHKETYFWELEKPPWDLSVYEVMDFKSDNIPIENLDARTFGLVFILADGEESLPITGNDWDRPKVRARVFDKNGKIKSYSKPGGYGSTKNEDETYQAECFSGRFESFKNYNKCVMTIPEDITLEKGDYLVLTVGFYERETFSESDTAMSRAGRNLKAMLEDGTHSYIAVGEPKELNMCNGSMIDYGVIYNNRIVGVRGSKICASALGDFSNFWEYVDATGNPSATGAYATDVGSQGDFTGICVYQNMLLLFKKNIVYEMYGSMPYTINELCSTGCVDNDSVCEIDGVLYWASPKGVVRYSGGVPSVVSTNVNIDTKGPCKAGTDGRKYYLYNGEKIYVYDTRYNVWHAEDSIKVKMFYGDSTDLYILTDDGIYKTYGGLETVEWEFETKDFTFSTQMRKNLSKIWVRAHMSSNTRLEVYVRQDGGEWRRTAVKTAEKDEMFNFKLRVKKCDSFAMKFVGKGDVKILDVHGRVTVGTNRHKAGNSLNIYRR